MSPPEDFGDAFCVAGGAFGRSCQLVVPTYCACANRVAACVALLLAISRRRIQHFWLARSETLKPTFNDLDFVKTCRVDARIPLASGGSRGGGNPAMAPLSWFKGGGLLPPLDDGERYKLLKVEIFSLASRAIIRIL